MGVDIGAVFNPDTGIDRVGFKPPISTRPGNRAASDQFYLVGIVENVAHNGPQIPGDPSAIRLLIPGGFHLGTDAKAHLCDKIDGRIDIGACARSHTAGLAIYIATPIKLAGDNGVNPTRTDV